MIHVETDSVDINGIEFMLARSKQFRKTVRIINKPGNFINYAYSPYYYDHDIILCANKAYIKIPDKYDGAWFELTEVSLCETSNPVPDVWVDDATVQYLHGNEKCKKEGQETILHKEFIMSVSDWEELLK